MLWDVNTPASVLQAVPKGPCSRAPVSEILVPGVAQVAPVTGALSSLTQMR